MLVEHGHEGLAGPQQLILREEIGERFCGVRVGPEAAADEHAKAAHLAPVLISHLRVQANVVNRRQAAAGAASEADLELARQVLRQRVAQEKISDGAAVGRHVERFALAGARLVAGGDVSHRVAAGLAGGEAVFGQLLHALRHVLQLDEMKLDVLPGGHVQDAVRKFVGEVGQALELTGGEAALGQLGAHHLLVILALAVDALLQAKTLEILLVHFAPVQPLDLGGEFLDFPFDMGRDIQCFCIHVQPLAL